MTDFAFARRVMALWDFDDPAGSQERFADAAAGEPAPAHRASLLTQVARAQVLQDEFGAAHTTLDAVGDPARLADEPAVRALLERGRLHYFEGTPDDAVPAYRAAFDRATAAGLAGLAVDAAHMLAIVRPEAEHEEWVRVGLSLADGSADPLVPGMVAALLTNLAWCHVDNERWEQALELFERVVEIRRSGDAASLHTAQWTRAWVLRALGRHEDALGQLRQLAASPAGAADPCVATEITENERALSHRQRSRSLR
jgi:tetratricopeptide (TPR) repeat protein